MAICSVTGCARPIRSIGLCGAHYRRKLRYGDPTAGGTLKGEPQAFIQAALAAETDECIEWPFARQQGYGVVNDCGSTKLASRVVCERAHGTPPPGQIEAAHSCGNRPCINKRHIRWATCAENTADKVGHGTFLVGERVPSARFAEDDIRAIRRRRSQGESQGSIARHYGVTSSHIRRIIDREIWAHVADEQPRERTVA